MSRPLSLGSCRNPDGTWNGAKTMAKLTGETEQRIVQLWRRIGELRSAGVSLLDAANQATQEQRNERGTRN